MNNVTVTAPAVLTRRSPGQYRVGVCTLPATITIDIDGLTHQISVTTDDQAETIFCNGMYIN